MQATSAKQSTKKGRAIRKPDKKLLTEIKSRVKNKEGRELLAQLVERFSDFVEDRQAWKKKSDRLKERRCVSQNELAESISYAMIIQQNIDYIQAQIDVLGVDEEKNKILAANISEERELLESRIDIITQGMFETAHEILNTYDEIILHSELSSEVLWSVQESEQDSQFSYDSEDDNTE